MMQTDFYALASGKSRAHLVPLDNAVSGHFLQKEAAKAFNALQASAQRAGFQLQPASTFRDFARQLNIWNAKFDGNRKVHDDQGKALDLSTLDEWAKCRAILRWSAVPGASRHHWGSEIDFYAPDLLPSGQALQLEPWEYQAGGYFAELTAWINENAAQFDFILPFDGTKSAIGIEPWHLSYAPLAEKCQANFSPDVLRWAWRDEALAGKACLLAHLDTLFSDFIL